MQALSDDRHQSDRESPTQLTSIAKSADHLVHPADRADYHCVIAVDDRQLRFRVLLTAVAFTQGRAALERQPVILSLPGTYLVQ